MRDKTLAITIVFILSAISVVSADTRIFKYVDSDGRITFSNRPIEGENQIQSIHYSTKSRSGTLKNTPPFEVSEHTQKKRDAKRRRLLDYELKNELRLLANAKLILARNIEESELIKINSTQPGNDAIKHKNTSIQALQKRVLLHERNVTALKKELSSF